MADKRPARRSPENRIEALVKEGTTLVRNYATIETSKTMILKELARVVVELRSNFHTEDGKTDWAGRSHAYRETVARIYHEAGVEPDSVDGMQAALRWHIGNIRNEIAPPEELEDLGIQTKRPLERVKETRDRLAALARLGATVDKAPAVPTRLILAAEVNLTKVKDSALAKLEPDVVEDLVSALEQIAERAEKLLAALGPFRKRRRGGRRNR